MLVEKLPQGFITEGQRNVYRETIMKNPYLQEQKIRPYVAIFSIVHHQQSRKDR